MHYRLVVAILGTAVIEQTVVSIVRITTSDPPFRTSLGDRSCGKWGLAGTNVPPAHGGHDR
jgi:hypothetical protein